MASFAHPLNELMAAVEDEELFQEMSILSDASNEGDVSDTGVIAARASSMSIDSISSDSSSSSSKFTGSRKQWLELGGRSLSSEIDGSEEDSPPKPKSSTSSAASNITKTNISSSTNSKSKSKTKTTSSTESSTIPNATATSFYALDRQVLPSHVQDLSFQTKFFGVYWRNRNSNICGFPSVGSVSHNLDYQTWLKQQSADDATPAGNHDAIKIKLIANAVIPPDDILIITRICCLTDLPATDSSLVNHVYTKEQIFSEIPEPVIFSMAGLNDSESVTQTTNAQQGSRTYTISLAPRAWKYLKKGSRLTKKEDYTFKPIVSQETADTFSKNIIVTYQVVIYVLDNSSTVEKGSTAAKAGKSKGKGTKRKKRNSGKQGEQYRCIGTLRSSGFIIGSTRHLRRITNAAKSKEKEKL